ncbi:MAG TPA: protease modulator HflK, partial [Gammaproteobacteria bacterium]|nr:protease modulator HflK [Gammaproteobacteria bacterium]
FRQMQSKLSNIFGGGGSGGSSGSSGGGKLNSRVIGFGLVALVFLYGAWGVYQIDAQERGVVFRFGSVQSELIQPGLAWNPPIVDVVEKVNVTKLNSHKHQSMMLTEDE